MRACVLGGRQQPCAGCCAVIRFSLVPGIVSAPCRHVSRVSRDTSGESRHETRVERRVSHAEMRPPASMARIVRKRTALFYTTLGLKYNPIRSRRSRGFDFTPKL